MSPSGPSSNATTRPHEASKSGPVSTTSSILGLVGEVTKAVSDVPYLGAIATVVTTLIKIREDLQTQKERSQELLDRVLKKIEDLFLHLLDLKKCHHRGDLRRLEAQMREYHEFLNQVVKIVSKLQKRKFHQRVFDRGTGELERLDRMINNFDSNLILGILMEMMKTSTNTERTDGERAIIPEDGIATHFPAPPVCIFERDLQHSQIVAQLLTNSNVRVALLGMGGIGKTTLACSIARDSKITDAYPRRLFLSFEGCSTPDLAYTSIANIFQIPSDKRTSHDIILSQVLSYLKEKKTLVVIDNFETFWEVAANRRAAENFLGQLSDLQELAMIKVHRRILAGIPLAVTLIGSLLRDESETPQSLWHQWLQESARAIRVTNEPTSDDRLYKLDTSLRLSIFGPRMNDDTRCMLATISILPIGLNMDEKWLDNFQKLLTDTFRARDCIRTLRDVALVTLDSSTSPPRLRMLPPVRDFCLNNLPLDGDLPRKLIDIYNTYLMGHWDWASSTHYAWATTELSNLTAILNHAITISYVTDDLGRATLRYTNWRRFLRIPDTDTVKRAIDIMPDHPIAQALCLQAYGTTLSTSNRVREAIQPLKDALATHRKLKDMQKVGEDLYFLGHTYYLLNDLAEAEQHLSEARDLATEIDDNWIKGMVLQALADIYRDQDKLPEAESVAEEALNLCSASRNRQGAINALTTLGQVHHKQGQYELAIATLTLSRNASQAVHDTHAEACAAKTLGYVYRDDGKPEQAAMQFRSAVSLFEQAQEPLEAEKSQAALRKLEEALEPPNDQ